MAEQTQVTNEMSDVEIAELANKEIKLRDAKIAELNKELAKAKLYQEAPEPDEGKMTREECIKVIGDASSSNYDYAGAVVNLVEIEEAEGRPNPLGDEGKEVYQFFKNVLSACDGDKSAFTSVYQSKLKEDDREVTLAYQKAIKQK